MPYHNTPIERRLAAAHLAISNALADPDILALLSQRSYDAGRLGEGKALLDAARALQEEVQRMRGNQFGSTDAVQAAWEEAKRTHAAHLELARVALVGDRKLQEHLGLIGTRARTMPGWIKQARAFYRNALASPDALALLEPYGMEAGDLEAGLMRVEAVEEARLRQAHEQGEAQDAAERSRAAMAALDGWMRPFLRVSRVALRDRPQWLEKLGVLARS